MKRNNIIIIGGGPSGSTAASYLAMAGHKVTLFEREKFPRPHVGESLIPFTYGLFDELGVLDTMKKRYNRKPGVKFSNSDGSASTVWYFDHVIKDPSSLSFHVERAGFDKMLLDRSKELGAEVIEETAVKGVDLDSADGKVKITTLDRSGIKAEHEADFIIDASGQSTFLANKFKDKDNYEGLDRVALNGHWGNPTYDKELAEGCIDIFHLGGEKKGWIWAIPLSDVRLSVGVVMSSDYFKSQRKKFRGEPNILDKIYLNELSESAAISSILKNAEKEAPAMAHGDYSYYTNTKFGNNFAIIGDAGAFLDPIFSSGIYVGMVSAKMVAENLHQSIQNNGNHADSLEKVYRDIQGGYDLVEKLIRTFYDPDAISLPNLENVKNKEYEKFHTAYTIYHYLLAGDFFRNHKKYSKTVDILRNAKQLEKYKNLIKNKTAEVI